MLFPLGHQTSGILAKGGSNEVIAVLYLSVYMVEEKEIVSFSVLQLILHCDPRDESTI